MIHAPSPWEVAHEIMPLHKAQPVGCQKCGSCGLHACAGAPAKPITAEQEQEWHAALRQVADEEGRSV